MYLVSGLNFSNGSCRKRMAIRVRTLDWNILLVLDNSGIDNAHKNSSRFVNGASSSIPMPMAR